MADSLRQDIIDAVKVRLATITVANGYETGIGANVFDFKTDDWAAEQLPGVNLTDIEEEVGFLELPRHEMTLKLVIEAVNANGTTTGAWCRKALADIVKAFGTDKRFGGLVINTYYRGNQMGLLQNQKTVGAVEVRFDLKYRLNQFDPYTNPGQ